MITPPVGNGCWISQQRVGGCRGEGAVDGEIALEDCCGSGASAGDPYRVALLDMKMPASTARP